MSTLTPNYSFILPGVNDPTDQDLWGGYLNENWTSVDGLITPATNDLPIGAGMDFWGSSAPSKFVFAYGQTLNRTTYSSLFTQFGTTYGAGDGSTTFGIPDKRDRASFGKGDMGGTSADRITDQSGGWEGDTLGDSGGSQTHTLITSELASHTHQASAASYNGGTAAGSGTTHLASQVNGAVPGAGGTGPINTGSAGSGGAHNNLPPGIVCNYIIYTGVA